MVTVSHNLCSFRTIRRSLILSKNWMKRSVGLVVLEVLVFDN